MATLNESYTFFIEDLTAPALDSILWIDPRRCRIRFTEALLTTETPGGSLFLKHLKGGFEIVDSSTIQLMSEIPASSWIGYSVSMVGSAYPQNNKSRPITAVDVLNRRLTLDTSGSYGYLVSDTGVDSDANGNIVRTRLMRLTVSPWLFEARLSDEGAGTIPESAERIQVAYLPIPVQAQLPTVDEIPLSDVIEQYVVLDFHDDVSFGRMYTVSAENVQDTVGNVLASGSLNYTTPVFGRPHGRITLWDMIPETIQLEDMRNDGELRKMCVILQDLFNSLWYRVDQMQHVPDPATCPRHLLDFMLHKFGNPFRFVPGNEQPKRRLAGRIRQMYRKLGTIGGIEDILEFFLVGVFDVEPLLATGGWILNESTLTIDTVLGGGSAYYRNCYLVRSYRALTADERQIITEICTWADPVNMHLVAIVEPGGPMGVTFWVLTKGILSATTTLSL